MSEYLVIEQKLYQNQSIYSPSRKYVLIQQSDGNLVLYLNGTGRATWHTNTATGSGNYAVLQSDGNFVVYDQNGTALWGAGSNRDNFQGILIVTDDGKITILDFAFDVTSAKARP